MQQLLAALTARRRIGCAQHLEVHSTLNSAHHVEKEREREREREREDRGARGETETDTKRESTRDRERKIAGREKE